MYCKNCGTQQKDGQKFCPKCGNPFAVKENCVEERLKDHLTIKATKSKKKESSPIENDSSQSINQEDNTEKSDVRILTPKEKKNALRIARLGVFVIIVAIILTFVNAGFFFSFWWYVILFVLAFIAFFLFGFQLPEQDGSNKDMNTEDTSVLKVFVGGGIVLLAILNLWGPLSPNYTSGEHDSYERTFSNEDSSNGVPKWLTEWKFVCETNGGGKIVISLNNDGSAHMTIADGSGAALRGTYNGTAIEMNYKGAYTVSGNYVYLSFGGMSQNIVLEMDSEQQRLYGEGGGVFKQSAF